MPDDRFFPSCPDASPDAVPVGEALRALPLEAPDRSAWPALAQAMAQRRSRRAPRWPWALAAAVALAVALPLALRQADAPVRTAPADGLATPTLATPTLPAHGLEPLLAESARLEALIQLGAGDASSAGAALIAASLEDHVARIDARLAHPGLDAPGQHALWTERVATLRQLADVEGTRRWLSARGEDYDGALLVSL